MKKLPAILLLAILLVNAAGFYVYYIIEFHRIHVSVRASISALPDSQLTRLAFPEHKFEELLVEEDEMKVDGQMFDIARKTIKQDSVIVFALRDEKEENLIVLLDEILTRPLEDNSQIMDVIAGFNALHYIPSDYSFEIENRCFDCEHRTFLNPGVGINFHEALVKPPRNARTVG